MFGFGEKPVEHSVHTLTVDRSYKHMPIEDNLT